MPTPAIKMSAGYLLIGLLWFVIRMCINRTLRKEVFEISDDPKVSAASPAVVLLVCMLTVTFTWPWLLFRMLRNARKWRRLRRTITESGPTRIEQMRSWWDDGAVRFEWQDADNFDNSITITNGFVIVFATAMYGFVLLIRH